MVMANHAWKAIFVLLFLLTALPRVCQSGSVPTVKKVIGPAGGKIELKGDVSGVTLDIPAGALTKETEITIRQAPTPTAEKFVPKETPVGNAFSFEPKGLIFSKPAAVGFSYDKKALPQGSTEGNLFICRDSPIGFIIDDGPLSTFEEGLGPKYVFTYDSPVNRPSVEHSPLPDASKQVTIAIDTLRDRVLCHVYLRRADRLFACDIANLKIYGWSPEGDYFAFGYDWADEEGNNFHRYIINSEKNAYYRRLEKKVLYDGDDVPWKELRSLETAFIRELRESRIDKKGEQVFLCPQCGSQVDFAVPAQALIDLDGRAYSLILEQTFEKKGEDERDWKAKFKLSLVDKKTGKTQVLQEDKAYFREAYRYGIYAAYLSPRKDHITVIIAQYQYIGFEGNSAVNYLGVTGKLDR